MTRDELIPDAEGDRGRPKGPQGVDRDALIEKARALALEHGVDLAMGDPIEAMLVFAAQAREEAIDDVEHIYAHEFQDAQLRVSALRRKRRAPGETEKHEEATTEGSGARLPTRRGQEDAPGEEPIRVRIVPVPVRRKARRKKKEWIGPRTVRIKAIPAAKFDPTLERPRRKK